MGTSEYLRWYAKYPTLPAINMVDIRMYEMSDTREPIKQWLGYNNEGFFPIILTDEYFPPVTGLAPNVIGRRWYKFVLTPAGEPLAKAQDGPIFQIIDIPRNNSGVTTTTRIVTITLSSVPSNYDNSGSFYTTGKAVGIIIGSILGAILVGGAIVFYVRRSRKQPPILMEKKRNQNTGSTSSHTKLLADKEAPLGSSGNVAQFAPLTANEAYLIADTYRESLRKPGWEDGESHTEA
ncbi:hypothetical protein K7432_005302 [Basidiobolus ranarum]|uniref:Uncharacterized protein n=1 Tax=Basidiobolus ranarum TaxID=34480 RepID=A0ABR2W3C1_9FUNG